MIIELILFLAFVVAVGAVIVKAYEWRQDSLYGPYIFPAFLHQNKRMAQYAAASQVRESDELNSRPTDDGGAGVGHDDTRPTHDYELHAADRCHGGAAGCIRLRSGSQRRMIC
jgi:hypothetical protein